MLVLLLVPLKGGLLGRLGLGRPVGLHLEQALLFAGLACEPAVLAQICDLRQALLNFLVRRLLGRCRGGSRRLGRRCRSRFSARRRLWGLSSLLPRGKSFLAQPSREQGAGYDPLHGRSRLAPGHVLVVVVQIGHALGCALGHVGGEIGCHRLPIFPHGGVPGDGGQPAQRLFAAASELLHSPGFCGRPHRLSAHRQRGGSRAGHELGDSCGNVVALLRHGLNH